jgi:tRNA A37 threonylcarbamoyladenosine synthetase subunit TsaC/SUA5/YrdC
MALFLEIHPDNPQEKYLNTIVECLKDGGVIIYPTDTVYGIGCDINKTRAVERVCKIKTLNPKNLIFL